MAIALILMFPKQLFDVDHFLIKSSILKENKKEHYGVFFIQLSLCSQMSWSTWALCGHVTVSANEEHASTKGTRNERDPYLEPELAAFPYTTLFRS